MITFLFGAGASYGCGMVNPPPLGMHLFNNLIKLNGSFSNLSNDVRHIFLTEGFEAGMAKIANDADAINPLQKEVACYLSSFVANAENAYARLFRRLDRMIEKINVATLNYDLLIEQSLEICGIPFDYNPSATALTVEKIHGSSNFLPEMPKNIIYSDFRVTNFGCIAEGLKVKAPLLAQEVKEWCDDPRNIVLSPILAMYQKDKRIIINKRLISDIQTRYFEKISKSSHIVVVGVKYLPHDGHVWDCIEKSNADLLIVDPFPEETLKWAALRKGKTYCVNRGFDKSVWDIYKFVRQGFLYN